MILSLFFGFKVIKEEFKNEFLSNDKDELNDELAEIHLT